MRMRGWADQATVDKWRQQSEKYQERAEKLYDEANEIYARFEHGQPIILNHHSTRQAQADRNRADDRMRHGVMLEDRARVLRERVARHQREIDRRQMVEGEVTREDVAVGDTVWRKPSPGSVRLEPYRVVKVNAKSVSVETGYSWADRIPYTDLVGVEKK